MYLDNTPHSILQSPKTGAWADFVLPGYHTPSKKIACCLRCSVSERRPVEIEPRTLLFMAITALRLRSPLHIHVAGEFELGESDYPIKNAKLSYNCSVRWPGTNSRYNSKDIHFADKIARRYIEIVENKYKRLISAIILYFQAIFGSSNFFQLSYLGLSASLEALFVPKDNKAKILGHRVASFLSNFNFPFSLPDWFDKEYGRQRGNLAHGVQDVMPSSKVSQEKLEAFGRLHELTRLSILGFMSLENGVLEKLSRKNGNSLQNELKNLPVANGVFLQDQKPYCK